MIYDKRSSHGDEPRFTEHSAFQPFMQRFLARPVHSSRFNFSLLARGLVPRKLFAWLEESFWLPNGATRRARACGHGTRHGAPPMPLSSWFSIHGRGFEHRGQVFIVEMTWHDLHGQGLTYCAFHSILPKILTISFPFVTWTCL